MEDPMMIIWGFTAGLALGWVFFQGLSWTVRNLPSHDRPWLLFLSSFLIRFGLAVLCFIILAKFAGWQSILACLAGFVSTRALLARIKPSPTQEKP
jgi:F1F0 ATPase subunit 2